MRDLIAIAAFLIAATPTVAGAQTAEDRGWDTVLTDFSEADVARLSGAIVYETPELYELAVIILALTQRGSEFVVNSDYAREVREHFGAYAGHPIVATLGVQNRRDSWFRAYDFRENAYVFCFDQENRIVRCTPYSHAWGRQANSFSNHLDLVADFARVSGFREFYRAHQAFYAGESEVWRRNAPIGDMQTWLERRFPERIQHYAVVFSPLVSGWHSTQGLGDEGLSVAVLFLQSVSNMPDHTAARIAFTEIDHNYVNRATERFIAQRGSLTFEPTFWSTGSANAYGSAETVFNEYMTWSVFLLWARDYYPPETRDAAVQATVNFMEGRRGFTHFAAFDAEVARLCARQRGRENIPALYPDLLRWAETYQRSQPAPQ